MRICQSCLGLLNSVWNVGVHLETKTNLSLILFSFGTKVCAIIENLGSSEQKLVGLALSSTIHWSYQTLPQKHNHKRIDPVVWIPYRHRKLESFSDISFSQLYLYLLFRGQTVCLPQTLPPTIAINRWRPSVSELLKHSHLPRWQIRAMWTWMNLLQG